MVMNAEPLRVRHKRWKAAAAGFMGLVAGAMLPACSADVPDSESDSLDFATLSVPRSSRSALPVRESYQARDGRRLYYRRYASDSDTWLVLIHGSATDSVYLRYFARSLARAGAAQVITPDLRGHGPSPAHRGDIAYVDQLEDDLADLVSHLDAGGDIPSRVVIGGHSSGGGMALRFGGSRYGDRADGYLLLAPYLGHDAPTARENAGGWAEPNLTRIVPIAFLDALGIDWFNGVDVLHFNMPPEYRTGSETLDYSYRLMKGFAPTDYAANLSAIQAPILLLAGAADEAFRSGHYGPAVTPHAPAADVELLEGVSHLELMVSDRAVDRVARWLAQL